VHVSTDVVFDGLLGRPYVESDPPSPCTAYGRAKTDAEALVADACRDALIVRTSLIVGGPGHKPSKHELVATDPTMTFYENEIRNPIQATDLGRALLELARSDVVGMLHLAGPDALSRAELAALAVGRPVRSAPAPPGRPLDCRLASARSDVTLRMRIRGAVEVFSSADR
jgi:dTDP-4-dehydrorhamnose reductase